MNILARLLQKIRKRQKTNPLLSIHSSAHIHQSCAINGEISIGKHTTLGNNCFFSGTISIGNYCQFGACASAHSRNHPIHLMSTYNNPRLFHGELKEKIVNSPIEIGNDVWVGHGATVLSGVKIGDGAVLGAGCVVTKDVPDFAVVAGVPAQVIKMRFDEETIQRIKDLKWWEKEPSELEEIKHLFFEDLAR